MWFKQVQCYEITPAMLYQPEELAAQLQAFTFVPCLPSLPLSMGWVPPLNQEGAPLIFAADGYLLMCLAIAQKVLPASVVRQSLEEKIKAVEARDQCKLVAKQRQALKDEIIQTLLPRAFVTMQRVYLCIDTRHQWLWVSTTSARYTEYVMSAWKKVFPNRDLVKPTLRPIASILSHWLQHSSYPKEFMIEKKGVLQDTRQQTRVIRCQQQDLFAPGIQSLLKDGCEIRQLALCWQDRINFILDDEFQWRQVRFKDEVIECGVEDTALEAPELRFASDFALVTTYLTELTEALYAHFVKSEEIKVSGLSEKSEYKAPAEVCPL